MASVLEGLGTVLVLDTFVSIVAGKGAVDSLSILT